MDLIMIELDLNKLRFVGKLEVLNFSHMESGRSKYKCKCICGKIMFVDSHRLQNNKSTQCRNCAQRKYVGEVSMSYFNDLKRWAIKRGKEFKITQFDIWEKFLSQGRKCVYSGLELTWQDGKKGILGTASVDRVNSKIGYTKDNIQITHKDINTIKWNFQQQYFLILCEKVAYFNKKLIPILNYQPRNRGHKWVGFGEISGHYWGKIRHSAKSRKIQFNLEIEYCWDLYLKQGGVCALSGIPIKFETCAKEIIEKTASLDRINQSIGYVEGNVQWVHKHVNNMKQYFTDDYFIELCKLVVINNKKV